MLARVNNVERDSQICNATSRAIEKYGTRKHTHKEINGVVQPWVSQNVEFTEKSRVAQLKRDASTIAQSADTTLVHNL